MVRISFPFEKKKSPIFGNLYRPVAEVNFWSEKTNNWVKILMIVDTGADYTILPRFYAHHLGIDLSKTKIYKTFGIGGKEKVYLLRKIKISLGNWKKSIPVGFLNRNDIPPLMGREEFLETFDVLLSKHVTYFSLP